MTQDKGKNLKIHFKISNGNDSESADKRTIEVVSVSR